MQPARSLLTACFCAGMIGALCNSLVAWQFGYWGLTGLAGPSARLIPFETKFT